MANPSPTFLKQGGAWVIAQMTLLLVIPIGGALDGSAPASRSEVRCYWGLIFFATGALLGISGALALGRNLTPLPKPRQTNQLVTHGPYSIVRHPLYTSMLILGIGWAVYWKSPSATLGTLLLTLVLNAKASREESWLTQQHPDYVDYQKRVKKLIPWIY